MRPAPFRFSDEFLELIAHYRRNRRGVRQAAIAEGVRRLSEMFAATEPLGPGYMARRFLRQAYVCYYLPVHYAKVRMTLQELGLFASLPESPRVLDFGAGPGTASLAVLEVFARPRLALVDVVPEALEDARFLVETYARRPVEAEYSDQVPAGRFDLVIASNVMAEMADAKPLMRLLDGSLAPDGYFILVEPATRGPTRRVMAWRDELVAAGFRIAAPCVGADRCPMLARDDLWCHQDLPWPAPSFVTEIDRRLGFDKGSLKFSYLIVTRTGWTRTQGAASPWRVVSNLHGEKGKAWAWLCGRSGPLVRGELLTRHRSDGTRAFARARRGDVLDINPPPEGRMPPETLVRALQDELVHRRDRVDR